jgi:hypothetical protein
MNRSTIVPTFQHGTIPSQNEGNRLNNGNEESSNSGTLSCEMPQFGTAAVSAAESQYKYGSSTYEMVLPFFNILWYRPNGRNGWYHLVTVRVWLLSVMSVTTTRAEVSECQEKLYVYTRLPEILDIDKVDERNGKLYHTISGESIYPPSHVRSISEKMTISTLPRTDGNEVYFKQTIKLPFKCDRNPVKIGDRDGIQFKGYGTGALIKELVVNLVSVATPMGTDVARVSTIDTISVSGRTEACRVPGNTSVCSINPYTNGGTQVRAVVDSVYGNPASRPPTMTNVPMSTADSLRGSGTQPMQRIFNPFRQVLPVVPAYNQVEMDHDFPTPPVRVSPPLPPPPPVVAQGGSRAGTPIAECILGTEITTEYQEVQVQYAECVGNSTLDMECTSITKSARGCTGRAVQVTQGQCSVRNHTPSILDCGTIPGTKIFNECASYSGSESSSIATHDKDTTEDKVEATSLGTSKKSKIKKLKECGADALMMLAQKAGVKRVSSKHIRSEVDNVAFEESNCVVRPIGINPEEWDDEDDRKLPAYSHDFV